MARGTEATDFDGEPGRTERRLQDALWVAAARRGDQEAFRELFGRYRQQAYRLAYRFLNKSDEAADATQSAFIKAFGALDGFEGRSSFSTWLMRIVTNTCLDRRRSRATDKTVQLDDEMVELMPESRGVGKREPEGPVQHLEYEELRDGLFHALEELSEEHRTVFVLHTQKELTYREIAEMLGISEGTVMSRLYHARKNLQKTLSRAGLIGTRNSKL